MKKYCIVGTGNRGIAMFGIPLVEKYKEVAAITGLCDNNLSRLKYAQKRLGENIPVYTNFDMMLEKVPSDVLIVCSRDDTHHEYIIKALFSGRDVITEKPMTIDDEKCRQILDAEKKSGKKVYVTFNCRFIPYIAKIKELLNSGIIGDVKSVDFEWYLDTVHGADYYRRWHRRKEYSGGLLVHKSTHHFDMVNWWLAQKPQQVFAYGSRNFYGDKGAFRGERCLTCKHKSKCQFHIDIREDNWLKEVYLDHENYDKYYRDRCIFDMKIDIEDTMSVIVKYSNGIQLNYSLISYAPFEGWNIAINGTKGRLEAFKPGTFVLKESLDYTQRECSKNRKAIDWRIIKENSNFSEAMQDEIRIYPLYGGIEIHTVDRSTSAHGGGDEKLLDMLFLPNALDEKGAMAGSLDGAMSILIGVAANYSIVGNCPVNISELLDETSKSIILDQKKSQEIVV